MRIKGIKNKGTKLRNNLEEMVQGYIVLLASSLR